MMVCGVHMTGFDILAILRMDDDETWKHAMDKLLPSIVQHAFGVVGNIHDAEDVAQMSLMDLRAGASKVEDKQFCTERDIYSWVRIIIRNRAMKLLRTTQAQKKRDKKHGHVVHTFSKIDRSGDDVLIEKEMQQVVQDSLELLQEQYATPLKLRYFEEHSFEEIARRLNCTVGVARCRVKRALPRLEKQLKRLGMSHCIR